MKVYWNHPDLKLNVRAVGFLSGKWILFIEREVNWEIIKNWSWTGPLRSWGPGPRSCCRTVPCGEGSNVLSTQVLNIFPNSSPPGDASPRGNRSCCQGFFPAIQPHFSFPPLHPICLWQWFRQEACWHFENKKPCLCLQLLFSQPPLHLWKLRGPGGKEESKQAETGSGRSYFKGATPEWTGLQVDVKERHESFGRVQGTRCLILKGGGDSHWAFWTAQSSAASRRQGWDRRWQQSIRLCGLSGPGYCHEVPTTLRPNSGERVSRASTAVRPEARSELRIKALAGLWRQIPNSQDSVRTVHFLPKNTPQPELTPKGLFCPKRTHWFKSI